jgi:hypothetical protein
VGLVNSQDDAGAIPNDPFKLAIYVYDKLTDFISHSQMINKTFLRPQRVVTDIYSKQGFRQLADDLSVEFKVQISATDVRQAETLQDLALTIVDKISK